MERVLLCTVALAALLAVLLVSRGPFLLHPLAQAKQLPVKDHIGAVASNAAPCSRIGINVLHEGGNAVDAAIAAEFCLSVIGMQWTGLGGGGYALVRGTDGSYDFVDFRETAPASASRDMYHNNINASIHGGLASGVPGQLRGLEYMHRHYASRSWSSLIRPSIHVARQGFRVSAELASAIEEEGPNSFLLTDDTWAIDFAPNGTNLVKGDMMTRKRYADFLEAIAHQGPDAFYRGPFANATIRAIRKANGTMTLQDLLAYSVISRKALAIKYKDFKIVSCGAPAGGSVVLSTLNIVGGYESIHEPSEIHLSTYRLDQAMRFAFGQRMKLGDPSFVAHMDQFEDYMISTSTATDIRSRISDTHTLPLSAYNPDNMTSPESHGTSHVSSADKHGMAVSMTTSLNLGFGSHVMVPETGLILNNEMNDFSMPNVSNEYSYLPSDANFIAPGKRPLSSMSPAIAEVLSDGHIFLLTGAAGGSKIITSTIQSLWHNLELNMSIDAAAAAPRFHDQLMPNEVLFEYTFDNHTVAFLRDRGLNVTWVQGLTYVQTVRRQPNGTFQAVAEPRMDDAGGYAI
ncbi:uncharacterized protein MYCFIDRAFT_32768 [Pseudocercospora fijiensis CIRAD86]|uniref:Glutathione hydrolase n=1 Tax=Pseudocercospora fijiensis (strain CIRAD86) TaxID=383855 RepID=M2ZR99_PSEFD|nr:uncharacterized protein MYCFIDRAFT_32768 [Pseudocercospora fijiensis CIRAD86]EME81579.1 hypothetical protein MYCFIDRAFT_32768 [Pseudocercospora fijiensis CIRAD86]